MVPVLYTITDENWSSNKHTWLTIVQNDLIGSCLEKFLDQMCIHCRQLMLKRKRCILTPTYIPENISSSITPMLLVTDGTKTQCFWNTPHLHLTPNLNLAMENPVWLSSRKHGSQYVWQMQYFFKHSPWSIDFCNSLDWWCWMLRQWNTYMVFGQSSNSGLIMQEMSSTL